MMTMVVMMVVVMMVEMRMRWKTRVRHVLYTAHYIHYWTRTFS